MAIREVHNAPLGSLARARVVGRDVVRPVHQTYAKGSVGGALGDGLLITLDGLDAGGDIVEAPYLPAVPGRQIRPRR